MLVRPLRRQEREPLLDLLDDWQQDDGRRGREFFGRYFDEDPEPERNVLVAEEAGALVSCVQIFPQRMRVAGIPVTMGGIGTVWTAPAERGRGIASEVLRAVADELRARETRISLLYSTRASFYARAGWERWPVHRWLLRRGEARAAEVSSPGFQIEPFDRARDLEDVRALHDAWSGQRDGTAVRDARAWESSLRVAGNPLEEFLVARRDGRVLAYLRSIAMRGVLVISEFGRAPDGVGALVALLDDQLIPRSRDPLVVATQSSAELRRFAVMTPPHDPPLERALGERALAPTPVPDESMMFQCIDAPGLARDLGVPPAPDLEPNAFLRTLLPAERLVVWPADRF